MKKHPSGSNQPKNAGIFQHFATLRRAKERFVTATAATFLPPSIMYRSQSEFILIYMTFSPHYSERVSYFEV